MLQNWANHSSKWFFTIAFLYKFYNVIKMIKHSEDVHRPLNYLKILLCLFFRCLCVWLNGDVQFGGQN